MSFLKRIFGLTDKIEYVENIDGADANASDEVNEPVVQEEPLPENEASADEPADPEEEHERRYRFETLRDDGLRAMQSGHVEYAVQCLTAALEYQDDSETWYSLSECYTHLNQGAKALPILQRLQGETPQNAQLYTDAAIAAEQMQDWTLMAANAGKAILLCEALRTGDMALLKEAATDQIHEPYRGTLIPNYETVRAIAEEDTGGVLVISGSGSTCLLISSRPLSGKAAFQIMTLPEHWAVKELPVCSGPERLEIDSWQAII